MAAILTCQNSAASDLAADFDTNAENWRASDPAATLTWENSGGTPAGYLSASRSGSTNGWYFLSPTNWAGDWSSYKVLKFDFSIPTRHYPDADRAGMVVIVGTNGQQMTWTASTPLWTWTHYEVSLKAGSFGVDHTTYDSIMTNVAEVRILAEFTTATETVGLDNVLVTAMPPVAQAQLISRFTDGTTQGWHAVDDVTLSVIEEGKPSFGLYANDWMDGRLYKVASPTNWAGDWSGFRRLSFDMKWTGAAAYHTNVELVRIFGANGQTLSWSNNLIEAVWTNRAIELVPESFNVSPAHFAGVMAHVSEMWIFGEFGGSDDLTTLDNIVLTADTNGPPVHTQNLISRFDTDKEGWVVFDSATLTWSNTFGISGGGLRAVDAGTGTARFQSPEAWAGDWRAFKALRFLVRPEAASRNTYGLNLWIVTWSGTNLTVVLPLPYGSWTPYTVELTPELFGVTTNEYEAIMADVACLWIRAELSAGGADAARLDNVMLLTEIPAAGLPLDRASDFEGGNQNWRYGDWKTADLDWGISGLAAHLTTGGNPDGFIRNTDTGEWTYWFTPETWAGDWRGLETVSFDFKIITGTAANLFGTRMVSICSPWTNLHADVVTLPVPGRWEHYEFNLTPATFGVSAELFNQVLRDAVMLGIRSEWISGTEAEGLDNFRLTKASDAYWTWADDFFNPVELADEQIAGTLADPDGDGASNFEEFIAGTSPTNQFDLLRIERAAVTNAVCLLDFNSRTSRLYSVESTHAFSATNTWSTVTNDIPGSGLLLTVPVPADDGQHFYRLKVRRNE